MTSKWQFFQRNLGEWHGTFASLDSQQQQQSCTSSILTLEQGDEQSLVLFSLKRWADASLKGVAIERGDPLDACLLYTSPSPRDRQKSRMPSSA